MNDSMSQTGKAPKGYKFTDVGLIPNDWDVKPLSAFADVKTGPFGSALHESDYVSDGTPIITVEHLSDQGVLHENLPLVSDADRIRLSSYSLRAGDIVFSRVGSIDRNALIREAEDGWLFSGRLLRVRFFSDDIHSSYVSYHFHSEPFKQRVRTVAVGQTMASLNTQILKGVLVVLPLESEQHAIASALSDVDRLIEALEKLIAKKRAIKQAAMQQLLTGKTRLPGFEGEWETKRAGDIGQFGGGSGFPTRFQGEASGTYPFFKVSDMNNDGNNTFMVSANNYINEPVRKQIGSAIFPAQTIVFAKVGAAVFLERKKILIKPSCIDNNMAGYISDATRVDVRFIHYVLLRKKLGELVSTTALPSLSGNVLAAIKFFLPPLYEQKAIATVLSDMDAEIEALEHRRDKTKQIKQGMMQQLLTGRIRLLKPEAQASATHSEMDTKTGKPHSWAFNEAVVISTLAKHFGKEDFPLGRKRYTKLSYLLHRHAEREAKGYLKKAAGPYNPQTKYGGPERIALDNGYVREHKNGPYTGFVPADNIAQAEGYFEKWYGAEAIQWLEQFRFKKNDELELLATVDMAAEELRDAGKNVDVPGVKAVIRSHAEWKTKLDREIFSDANIAKAIDANRELFGGEEEQ